jgi:hypothetical protein
LEDGIRHSLRWAACRAAVLGSGAQAAEANVG